MKNKLGYEVETGQLSLFEILEEELTNSGIREDLVENLNLFQDEEGKLYETSLHCLPEYIEGRIVDGRVVWDRESAVGRYS